MRFREYFTLFRHALLGATTGRMLEIGSGAPAFSVPDETGAVRSLHDFRGKTLVLWFYPKADTPGWTVEGKGFRDRIQEFENLGAVIVGVSFDTVEENQAFRDKFCYPFSLLCDTERALGIAYGACADRSAAHANRITVVVDPDGNVARVYSEVKPKTHPEEVLADLS